MKLSAPSRPYSPKWVRAILGPLGKPVPKEWLRRRDPEGHYSLWVVYQRPEPYPKHFVVRQWQVTAAGKVRTATEPRILASTLLEARAVIPYGLTRVPCGVMDHLRVLEVWF